MFDFYQLNPAVQEALLVAMDMSERDFWKLDREYSEDNIDAREAIEAQYPIVAVETEAFRDGMSLRLKMLMVFSADSETDYRNDIEAYDAEAERLNHRYGNIVVPAVEARKTEAWGYIHSRKTPFGVVYTETKLKDGTSETSVEYPQAKIDIEDEENRKQA